MAQGRPKPCGRRTAPGARARARKGPVAMFDFSTLFAVMLFVSAVAGVLLVFAWLQNRSIAALGLWGGAYLVSTVAMALLVAHRGSPALWPSLVAHPLWI